MRILIAKKNLIDARAFASYLSAQGHVVNVTSSLTQTPALVAQFNPELILLDYYFHPVGPLSLIQELKDSIPVRSLSFILTVPDLTPLQLTTALNLGVKGIIRYDDEIETLDACIKEIVATNNYLSPRICQEIEKHKPHDTLSLLTRSEKEVAKRILLGQSNKEIATALFRSIETIQNHRKAIKNKLGISGGKVALLSHLISITTN